MSLLCEEIPSNCMYLILKFMYVELIVLILFRFVQGLLMKISFLEFLRKEGAFYQLQKKSKNGNLHLQ